MFSRHTIKKLALWLGIVAFVSFAIAFGFFFGKSSFHGPFRGRYTKNVDEEKILPIQEIDTISISTTSADIHLFTAEANTVRAHFYGPVSASAERQLPYLTAEKESSTLKIKTERPVILGPGFSRLRLDIELPAGFGESINVDTVSGDVSVPDLDLENFSLKTVSGDVVMQKLHVQGFQLNTTSGDFEANILQSNHSRIKMVSGQADIDNFTGDLDFYTTSGDLNIRYTDFANSIEVGSVSGDIAIRLPQAAEFAFLADTTSGDIVCDFPITVQGRYKKRRLSGYVVSEKNSIKIKTTSGDITIEPGRI